MTHQWAPEKVGTFINLKALGDCLDLRRPGARLPDWKTVQTRYPELIDRSAAPDRWFISHRWDSDGDPDPTGWQLEALLELAGHYAHDRPNTCIWYDYMSLPQKPRTAPEDAIFKVGLDNIRHVVSSCRNVLLVSATGADHRADLDAQLLRGWIVFELYIARGNMKTPLPLYQREPRRIVYGRRQTAWDAVVPGIHAVAPWEDARHLETWFRRRGIACTNGADLAFIAGLLHDTLSRHPGAGPMPAVQFGMPMRLSAEEVLSFAFVNGCGLSPRRPDLFLERSNYDAWASVWTVVIRPRPAALPLDQWSAVTPAEVADRMIDAATGRSPMYPGILFTVSPDGRAVQPAIG